MNRIEKLITLTLILMPVILIPLMSSDAVGRDDIGGHQILSLSAQQTPFVLSRKINTAIVSPFINPVNVDAVLRYVPEKDSGTLIYDTSDSLATCDVRINLIQVIGFNETSGKHINRNLLWSGFCPKDTATFNYENGTASYSVTVAYFVRNSFGSVLWGIGLSAFIVNMVAIVYVVAKEWKESK